MIRSFIFISLLAIALSITACQPCSPPPQGNQTGGNTGDSCCTPESKNETKPVPKTEEKKAETKVEPSSEEAKQVVELIAELSGKTALTPAGTVKLISVDTDKLSDENFDLFAKQPDLETVEISNFRELNDSAVEKLTPLKKLKVLKLTNSGLTNAGVASIVSRFPELTSLDLSSNTLLTDDAIKEIIKLENLESLVIIYCNFSEFAMMDIAKHPKIKSLDIRANMQVGNIGLDFISKMPALISFKHMSGAVDDSGIQSLTAAKNLETLEMQDFNISDAAGKSIKQFEKLQTLSVFRCGQFGSDGLLALKGAASLRRLTLRDLPALNDTGMEAFREMPALKRLYLRELPSLSDAGMINLVYLKDLELLEMNEVPVSDKALESIVKLPNLKDLTLQLTNISDAGVDLLLTAPKLERLVLRNNIKLTDAGKTKLRDSKKFKTLDFIESVPKR
jgi:Leucine-rich repeat (LRR) protein